MTYLRRVLAGHIRNPNTAGAVVCALGCESNNIDAFFQECGLEEDPMLHRLTIQEQGGARKAVEAGIAMGKAMDLLIQQGGTAVLTEPTELLGIEGALAQQASSPPPRWRKS